MVTAVHELEALGLLVELGLDEMGQDAMGQADVRQVADGFRFSPFRFPSLGPTQGSWPVRVSCVETERSAREDAGMLLFIQKLW